MSKSVTDDSTASEAYQLLLLQAVTDYAIYMLDPLGTVKTWNPGAERFKGYTPEEIIGRNFSLFYSEEDRAAGVPQRTLSTALRDGKFETEAWRVRKDGSRFWAHVIIDRIIAGDGSLIGFAKVTRDISERKVAQDAERRFKILVQGVTDYAIYMLDPEGVVTNWNSGAERIKQYSEKEIIGQHFSRFYTPEDLATGLPARALGQAKEKGRFEAEGWRVRKDGSRFWAGVVIDAIWEEGQLIGFAKITRDLSERKQAAEQLEEAKKALFQAQKLEAIGQLTGGVAHDFNNLLTVIVSGLDMLRRRARDPRDERILDNALQAAQRGSQLTNQLLAFARKQSLNPQPNDPNRLIESFEAILRRAAGDNDFGLSLAPEMREVLVDAAQFEAALLNLVVNARDACGGIAGDCRISVTTDIVDFAERQTLLMSVMEPGKYVRIGVSDTGAGISPDTLLQVCEPFFTTKEVGKGTGLGLSQVYGFVSQSGGHLDIKSELTAGTTVRLFLPAGKSIEVSAPRNGLTVLVVDDDRIVLDLAAQMITELGYEVLTANDALEAMNVLRRERSIDILFSDVVMPKGMTGADLAIEAKALRPDLRVILASGYPKAALENAGESIAEATFLAKPYRWNEVANALQGRR